MQRSVQQRELWPGVSKWCTGNTSVFTTGCPMLPLYCRVMPRHGGTGMRSVLLLPKKWGSAQSTFLEALPVPLSYPFRSYFHTKEARSPEAHNSNRPVSARRDPHPGDTVKCFCGSGRLRAYRHASRAFWTERCSLRCPFKGGLKLRSSEGWRPCGSSTWYYRAQISQ